jgi:hypothetical protein
VGSDDEESSKGRSSQRKHKQSTVEKRTSSGDSESTGTGMDRECKGILEKAGHSENYEFSGAAMGNARSEGAESMAGTGRWEVVNLHWDIPAK